MNCVFDRLAFEICKTASPLLLPIDRFPLISTFPPLVIIDPIVFELNVATSGPPLTTIDPDVMPFDANNVLLEMLVPTIFELLSEEAVIFVNTLLVIAQLATVSDVFIRALPPIITSLVIPIPPAIVKAPPTLLLLTFCVAPILTPPTIYKLPVEELYEGAVMFNASDVSFNVNLLFTPSGAISKDLFDELCNRSRGTLIPSTENVLFELDKNKSPPITPFFITPIPPPIVKAPPALALLAV